MAMTVTAHVQEAAASLLAARQRTFLALVGIVVGIGSVIALLTVGNMAKAEAVKQFQALGTDVLSVFDASPSHGGRGRRALLTASLAPGLAGLAAITDASPYTSQSAELSLDGQRRIRVQRIGVTPAFARLHEVELAAGRFVSTFDGRRAFVVIGANVAQALREAGSAAEVGTRVHVEGSIYTVVGVLRNNPSSPPGVRMNDGVLLPIELAAREHATKEVRGITLRTAPGVHYLTATAEVKEHFARIAPGMTVRVDSPVRIIEQMEAQMGLFALLLGAVGGISLVVGGLGVMNAMLAAVAARRLEIGIRRSIGARRSDVQRQFLAESVLLCLTGGALGALLGVAASVAIGAAVGWTWQWSFTAVALGVGTSCAAGVFFGFHPARQAARLDPIAAMRAH